MDQFSKSQATAPAKEDLSTRYDYIVVGAGSTGCAVARRLVENTDARILGWKQEAVMPASTPSLTRSAG